ncbi:potassium-transporting ATPase subunit KdpC [Naasia lichenicola]|uniref:Potassium-transporting ATPase KdpC subunit n=1 Tax=Naasia lichenicola TaxID=2565933 RepID=A0A4S4FG26_9MICO|nr:potassium-transporting ATPase subunit KdpC [Naasia lichenicola]THG28712.1 potassium-transporting ATPase subunit KdpC [Naasia lichenicola]
MSIASRGTARQHLVAVRLLLIATVVLGIAYPFTVTGIAQLVAAPQANGSLLRDAEGEVVGSPLIGQSFTDADGGALPEWFQSRPSAAGDGYDGGASSGSNLGPENPDLVESITARQAAIAELDGVSVADIPADAVTASASGLDPQISPEYALLQADRVAAARGIPTATVEALVRSKIAAGDLGYLGAPTVNVLELNLALAQIG